MEKEFLERELLEGKELKIKRELLKGKELEKFLNQVVDGDWEINKDREIDVKGNVDMSGAPDNPFLKTPYIPCNFNKVTGNFNCSKNQLTILEGSPRTVFGSFDCSFIGEPEKENI